MAIQALRGFRDFYPEDQFVINYLKAKIAASCAKFGYEEFEGPVLESFELYAAKSSDEIVKEQAFVLQDRGGENITLRPELTPTLARMVASKQQQLTFPLRWWSFGRFWRYERPQKGRAREFYQWNLDMLGENSPESDVEILEVLIDFLQSVGVTEQDVVFDISDRAFATQLLAENNILSDKTATAFALVDRLAKLTDEQKVTFGTERGLTEQEVSKIIELFSPQSTAWEQSERLQAILRILEAKGLRAWVRPNLSIVRGFTYYTGMVFELTVREGQSRALLGGGRYSNLVADVGGQSVDGVGMGMGDITLTLFLQEKGLLPEYQPSIDACVITISNDAAVLSQTVAKTLRDAGKNVINYRTQSNPGKGLKFANQKQIKFALILGETEAQDQTVTVKNLETGEQTTVALSDIVNVI